MQTFISPNITLTKESPFSQEKRKRDLDYKPLITMRENLKVFKKKKQKT